jgi:hypothetical protein
MWEGGECWIIGGGPSIPLEFGIPDDVVAGVYSEELPISAYSPFLSPIHDKHIIGINTAFLFGSWIDLMFFGDGGFYFANKPKLDRFPKVKVSSNPHLLRKKTHDIKYVPRNVGHPDGISTRENTVAWNLNSGAASISIAYQLGVKKIYLLGFDMHVGENGDQHWHRHYNRNKDPKKKAKQMPFARHLKGFFAIARDAERLGLEIINVSPNSKIEQFKRVKLSDVL